MAAASSAQPKIAQCFKVYDLLKMDQDHYWANWANACPYTIDSVYIMVRFSDRSRRGLGNGVWALHFVVPGTHQVTRFTAPRDVPDFDFVHLRKITTDWMEALLEDPSDRTRVLTAEEVRSGDPGPAWKLAAEPKARVVGEARLVADDGPSAVVEAPRVESASAVENYRRGRALLKKRQYTAAIAELSEAIKEQPGPLVYNARGFAYYLAHDYPRALADLDEAIRLNPRYLNAYQNRSRSRKAAGDARGSAADSKKARALLRHR